jgi:hypothetical protein
VHHGRDSDQMKERNPAEIVWVVARAAAWTNAVLMHH